jgi:hypothetical protein
MFRGFARDTGAPCHETLRYPATAFPATGQAHEEEWLLRIGPIPQGSLAKLTSEREPTAERVATTGGNVR